MGIFFKSIFACLFILGVLIQPPLGAQSIYEGEKAEVYKTTQLFLDALFIGNVSTIKKFIAGNLRDRLRTLLNENTEYSKTLQERYDNAFYQIGDPIIDGNRASVDVSIDFPEGKTSFFQIELEKINKLKWYVIKQTEKL